MRAPCSWASSLSSRSSSCAVASSGLNPLSWCRVCRWRSSRSVSSSLRRWTSSSCSASFRWLLSTIRSCLVSWSARCCRLSSGLSSCRSRSCSSLRTSASCSSAFAFSLRASSLASTSASLRRLSASSSARSTICVASFSASQRRSRSRNLTRKAPPIAATIATITSVAQGIHRENRTIRRPTEAAVYHAHRLRPLLRCLVNERLGGLRVAARRGPASRTAEAHRPRNKRDERSTPKWAAEPATARIETRLQTIRTPEPPPQYRRRHSAERCRHDVHLATGGSVPTGWRTAQAGGHAGNLAGVSRQKHLRRCQPGIIGGLLDAPRVPRNSLSRHPVGATPSSRGQPAAEQEHQPPKEVPIEHRYDRLPADLPAECYQIAHQSVSTCDFRSPARRRKAPSPRTRKCRI